MTQQETIQAEAQKRYPNIGDRHSDDMRHSARDGFIDGANFILNNQEDNAVGFLEWAIKNYLTNHEGTWIAYSDTITPRIKTTAELYHQYITITLK